MADTHLLQRRAGRFIAPTAGERGLSQRPAFKAYRLLQAGFVAAPLLAGLDKFAYLMTNWDQYLAAPIAALLPFSVHTFFLIVGVIEIAAAVLVAVRPRLGAFVVSAWLLGITINLLLPPGFYDIALRDFGLSLSACALGILSRDYGRPLWEAIRAD